MHWFITVNDWKAMATIPSRIPGSSWAFCADGTWARYLPARMPRVDPLCLGFLIFGLPPRRVRKAAKMARRNELKALSIKGSNAQDGVASVKIGDLLSQEDVRLMVDRVDAEVLRASVDQLIERSLHDASASHAHPGGGSSSGAAGRVSREPALFN